MCDCNGAGLTPCGASLGTGLPRIIYDGNSIPKQSEVDLLAGFTSEYGAPGTTYEYSFVAVGGKTVTDMFDNYASGLKSLLISQVRTYYVIHEIRNELATGTSNAQGTYDNILKLCRQVKCINPNVKIIVVQASASVDNIGNPMPDIVTVNSSIGSDTSGLIDLVVDLYNYSDVNGSFNDTTSGLYEGDEIHPNADGEAAIGAFIPSEIKAAYTTL